MAWRHPGDKPLSEPMMLNLLTHICVTRPHWVNWFSHGRCGCDFKSVIFKVILWMDILSTSCHMVVRLMPKERLIDDKSTLVQVMVWCHQATSHYLSQCWARTLSPHGVTRPQCVNTLRPDQNGHHFADNIFKWLSFNFFSPKFTEVCSLGSNGLMINHHWCI